MHIPYPKNQNSYTHIRNLEISCIHNLSSIGEFGCTNGRTIVSQFLLYGKCYHDLGDYTMLKTTQ